MILDTIVALSTAPLMSAIAVVRLSGDQAWSLYETLRGKPLVVQGKKAIFYEILRHPETHDVVDEVVVTVYRGPFSYTGEDVVEFSCHGNLLIVNELIALCLRFGARLATPGEFTQRAFYHNKVDLIQAEAINDLIQAQSRAAKQLALQGVTGAASHVVRALKALLLKLVATIEVNIDYPEYDDIEQMTLATLAPQIAEATKQLRHVLADAELGKTIRNGIKVAIVGRPNVGKSSLLNALIHEDKAIVTDIAGTTRDVVEGQAVFYGIPFLFLDTAGIRKEASNVEQLGIKKSYRMMDEADLVLLVRDLTQPEHEEERDLMLRLTNKPYLIVQNKRDLVTKMPQGVVVSAKDNDTETLEQAMVEKMGLDWRAEYQSPRLSNPRQIGLLQQALQALQDAGRAVEAKQPVDLVAIDLHQALQSFADLLGDQAKPDVEAEIFSRFCVGK